MKKFKIIAVISLIVIICLSMMFLTFSCKRTTHYKLAYSGKVKDQIEKAMDKHVEEHHAQNGEGR